LLDAVEGDVNPPIMGRDMKGRGDGVGGERG
jgi:hypothetical protein